MTIYTDGSCKGNGQENNCGGFGVVVVDDNDCEIATYSKQTNNTTNNREELKAILYALITYGVKEAAAWDTQPASPPIVYSDSAYAINTLTKWMYSWSNNNWKKSNNQIPENLDLIQAYFDLVEKKGYKIDLRYIKGHAGHRWNERADQLATGKIK